MSDMTTDLLSRIETLEARLRTLEATESPAAGAATTPTPTEHMAAEPSPGATCFCMEPSRSAQRRPRGNGQFSF